jgi:VanZ family protein
VAPALVYTGLVFWGGSARVPPPPFDPRGLPLDKLVHAGAFGVMQWLFWRAVRYEAPALERGRQALLAALLASAVGGTLELYQAALPDRSADLVDFFADVAGALVAAWVVTKARRPALAHEGTVSRAASSSRTNE